MFAEAGLLTVEPDKVVGCFGLGLARAGLARYRYI